MWMSECLEPSPISGLLREAAIEPSTPTMGGSTTSNQTSRSVALCAPESPLAIVVVRTLGRCPPKSLLWRVFSSLRMPKKRTVVWTNKMKLAAAVEAHADSEGVDEARTNREKIKPVI